MKFYNVSQFKKNHLYFLPHVISTFSGQVTNIFKYFETTVVTWQVKVTNFGTLKKFSVFYIFGC